MTEADRPGAVVTYEFTPSGRIVTVQLIATAADQAFADNNPILNAFTVEEL
eukprot:SAG31_NODE_4494_length_3187_cov_13.919365_5_plen_51_part_00